MELSEDIISKVIAFQGEDGLKAVKQHHEVEFSGFGKFYLSQARVKRRIDNLQKMLGHLKNKPVLDERKISGIEKELEIVKTKLRNEVCT